MQIGRPFTGKARRGRTRNPHQQPSNVKVRTYPNRTIVIPKRIQTIKPFERPAIYLPFRPRKVIDHLLVHVYRKDALMRRRFYRVPRPTEIIPPKCGPARLQVHHREVWEKGKGVERVEGETIRIRRPSSPTPAPSFDAHCTNDRHGDWNAYNVGYRGTRNDRPPWSVVAHQMLMLCTVISHLACPCDVLTVTLAQAIASEWMWNNRYYTTRITGEVQPRASERFRITKSRRQANLMCNKHRNWRITPRSRRMPPAF